MSHTTWSLKKMSYRLQITCFKEWLPTTAIICLELYLKMLFSVTKTKVLLLNNKRKMNQVSGSGFRMWLNLRMYFLINVRQQKLPFTFSFLKKMKQIHSYVTDSMIVTEQVKNCFKYSQIISRLTKIKKENSQRMLAHCLMLWQYELHHAILLRAPS